MSGRVMRAAQITAPGEVRLVEVAAPEPGPGEVLVRLQGCGVCGSNLPVWQGTPWFEYPFPAGAPGHEGWGWVERLGPGASQLAEGQRVTFLSQQGFAELDTAPAADVIPLPPELDDQPFPGEALACAMNVFRRSGIRAGETVAVIGVGFLGALVVGLAARAGARVIAISRRDEALRVAAVFGAAETIPMRDHHEVVERVSGLTRGALCDRVVEVAGAQWPLDLAAEITRVRGTLVIAGYHQDGPRQVNMQLWNWRGLDVINAHERDPEVYRAGLRAAIDAVVSGVFDPQPLYTHRYPLENLGDALRDLGEHPGGFMKALVMP